jgi:hypothetical protein
MILHCHDNVALSAITNRYRGRSATRHPSFWRQFIVPPCSSIANVIVEPPVLAFKPVSLRAGTSCFEFCVRSAHPAEGLVQEVWPKIAASPSGPVAASLSDLFRTADMLMIDRFR